MELNYFRDRLFDLLNDSEGKQMKAAEGVTEELKARNQLEWVGRMNNIRNRAEGNQTVRLIYI